MPSSPDQMAEISCSCYDNGAESDEVVNSGKTIVF